VVGFGDAREELEAAAPARTIFTGAMSHAELQRLIPLADALAVPSVLAEAFGMVAAEAAACGVVPVVADHSGLAEVADGLGEAGRRFDGSAGALAGELDALLRLPPDERRRLGAIARGVAVERWSWDGIARRLLELGSSAEPR
jgi:glycosyltransferase involved in cell wall biosynthesis